jgi:hypothetical protein
MSESQKCELNKALAYLIVHDSPHWHKSGYLKDHRCKSVIVELMNTDRHLRDINYNRHDRTCCSAKSTPERALKSFPQIELCIYGDKPE